MKANAIADEMLSINIFNIIEKREFTTGHLEKKSIRNHFVRSTMKIFFDANLITPNCNIIHFIIFLIANSERFLFELRNW